MKKISGILFIIIAIAINGYSQKISALLETTTISDPDLLHVVKLSPNIGYKMTFLNFRNYLLNTSGTGILPVANGGTGSSATATSGTLLRGNGSTWVPTALTFPNSTSNYEMLYSDGANNIISSPYVKASLYGIGIGLVTPTDPLSPLWAADGVNDAYKFHIRNTSSGTAASADLKLENNVQATGEVGVRSSLFTTNGVDVAGRVFLKSSNSSNGIAIFTTDNEPIVFATNGTTEKMRLSATGYLGVGTTNPLATLHVSGFSRIDASSGNTGLEISTSNSMALSLLTGGGGIEITNTSVGSPGINMTSNADGIVSHALGNGIEISSPGMVGRFNNSGVLSANNTTVGFSFEDNLVLGAFTSTGNLVQIRSNNASTRNLLAVQSNGGTDVLEVTSTGLVGINTGTSTPTRSLDVNGAIVLQPLSTVTLTAASTTVTVGNSSYIRVSSDNSTAANRLLVLPKSTSAGHLLTIEFVGATNKCQIVDDAAQGSGGNMRLSSTFDMDEYDIIRLISNGTDWIEISRSVN